MQSTIINTTMRYGLVLGVLFTLNFLLAIPGNITLALLSYVITGLIIYFTYRYAIQYRDKECGGFISFRRGFTFVFLLYFFASLISSFVKYFFLKFANTTFLEDTYNQSVLMLEQLLPAVTDEMYEALEILTNPQGYTMMGAWTNILLSVVMGIIIAAIVKRTPSPFDKN